MKPPQPPTKRSTPRLSEAARHLVLPDGIVSTGWPAVCATCRRLRIVFEPWQDGAGAAILGKRADGLYAADAVVMSIPRQVGKTFLVGAVVIALCIIEPRLLAVWTAHHGTTTADTFRDLKGIVNQPEVRPYVKAVYDSGARMEIIFTNESRVVFGAREHGFGRGLKKVGILIFDEGQILTSRAADDMVPTTNRHRNPLIFYIGTPPKPSDPSEHFLTLRGEALAHESTDIFYLEFSADRNADPLDREQWAKANPSYPVHTSARAMMRMKKNLGLDAFLREGLGIWDDTATVGVFTAGSWARCEAKPDEDGALVVPPPAGLGIASDIDQVWLSLSAASEGPRRHVGSVLHVRTDQKQDQFVAEVKRIQNEHSVPVGIDAKGPASFLIPDLEAAGVVLTKGGLEDYVQACADLRVAVETRQIEHGNYTDLNAAVDAAGWRKAGDRRVFARKAGEISALEAAAWACWATDHGTEFGVFGGELDLCDSCGEKPHEDPEGDHEYLCADCRAETLEDA